MSFLKWLDDHVERAKGLLTGQFDRSENVEKLLDVLVTPLQELEDVARDIVEKTSIDTGEGVQLDLIGEWVGEPRQGRSDEDYRRYLRFRIFVNTSDGEPETVITVLRFLTGASRIEYWENYPAALQLFTNGSAPTPELLVILQGVAPAGVGDIPITYDLGHEDTFRLARLPDDVPLLLGDLSLFGDDDGAPLLVDGAASTTEGGRLVALYPAPLLFDDGGFILADDGALIFGDPNGLVDPRETSLICEAISAEQAPATQAPYSFPL